MAMEWRKSSWSFSNGNCVEVAAGWRKSCGSMSNGQVRRGRPRDARAGGVTGMAKSKPRERCPACASADPCGCVILPEEFRQIGFSGLFNAPTTLDAEACAAFRMPDGLGAWYEQYAEATGQSVNAALVRALEEFRERNKRRPYRLFGVLVKASSERMEDRGMSIEREPTVAQQMMRAMERFIESFGRALAAEVERLRPTIEMLAEIASRPEVQAAMRDAEARRALREMRPCYCLCGRSHPGSMGACDGETVTTRRFNSLGMGPVDVPLCAPCAVAQGITEFEASGRS